MLYKKLSSNIITINLINYNIFNKNVKFIVKNIIPLCIITIEIITNYNIIKIKVLFRGKL